MRKVNIRRKMLDALYRSPAYPSIFFFPNPFKYYEFSAVKKRVKLERDHAVLDVGCGSGVQTNTLGRRCGRIVGIDVSVNDINRAKSELDWLHGNIQSEFHCTSIENAGFADESFDRVVSICVLEHIENDDQVLKEMCRVLKPKGRVVLTVDSLASITSVELVEEHRKRYKVHRYYNPKDLKDKLEFAGFENVEVEVLLQGQYAGRLFEAGIRNCFKYRYREAVFLFWKLIVCEWFSKKTGKGVYLAASGCRPPSS